MKEKIEKLADLLGKDLSGYRIMRAHFLELKHNLWGFFRAIYNDGECTTLVICTDLRVLAAVAERLPKRKFSRADLLMLVNSEGNSGFALNSPMNGPGVEDEPWPIMTAGKLAELTDDRDTTFSWQPGLSGGYIPPEQYQKDIEVLLLSLAE
jgi:hypothetical protein